MKKEIDSCFLMGIIENNFFNDDGLLSYNYPATEVHLLSDLDDYMPFFLHLNKDNLMKSQILASKNILKKSVLVERKQNRILSYSNNEYLGGLVQYYKKNECLETKSIIDKVIDKILIDLSDDGTLISYYDNKNKKKYPFLVPLSGGIIEELIGLIDLYPELEAVCDKTLDKFINDKFFKKTGLFITKKHLNSNLWNALFENMTIPIPYKVQNVLCNHFYQFGSWSNYIYSFPFGPYVQLAKDNTNLIYSIIMAYKKTKKEKYKNAIIQWVEGVKTYLIYNNDVYRYMNRSYKRREINLGHIHPLIDVLCDIYMFVDKDEKYIRIATKIMDKCINNYRWDIGLLPTRLNLKQNILDIQTDFAVSLWRLSECSNNSHYKKITKEIHQAILKYHFTKKGFVNSIDIHGNKKGTIFPKYNTLLLKLMILIENEKFQIYKNEYNHSIMRDR